MRATSSSSPTHSHTTAARDSPASPPRQGSVSARDSTVPLILERTLT